MADVILTVGHSNHPLGELIGLLARHGVERLADVRSIPASRFNPQFNRKPLEAALAAHGIAYEFLGAELGARSEDPTCYQDDRVSYALLAETPAFRGGIERLLELAAAVRVAIMCAEHEPLDCHRTILVGRELVRRGESLAHIRRDGSLESGEEADARLAARLKLDAEDLFHAGRRELVERAYDLQSERIAYRRSPGSKRER